MLAFFLSPPDLVVVAEVLPTIIIKKDARKKYVCLFAHHHIIRCVPEIVKVESYNFMKYREYSGL